MPSSASPFKMFSSGQTQSKDQDFHVIPDLHGNWLTLIQQCMQCIPSFTWDGQKSVMQKYQTESNASHGRLMSLFTKQANGYQTDYVSKLKETDIATYDQLDGQTFIEGLKDDLKTFVINESDKNIEIVFAGDLLADRQTNTLYMLYTFQAIQAAGVNFKIIFSNHDEIFFNMYARLKANYEKLDPNQLTDINYVKQNFLIPMRNYVHDEVGQDLNFKSCYASLVQFAFTIEKQIYDIDQANKDCDPADKQSLVSGFSEVVNIVGKVYMPNLKLAYIQDLETTGGKRPYMTTHAPQAMLSLMDAGKFVENLFSQQPLDASKLKTILRITSIYTAYQMPYQKEIDYTSSLIDALGKTDTTYLDLLRRFIQSYPAYVNKDLSNDANVKDIATTLIAQKVNWFACRIFYMPVWIKEFVKIKKNSSPSQYTEYELALKKASTLLDKITQHMRMTQMMPFYHADMAVLKQPFENGYVNMFYGLSEQLKVLKNLNACNDGELNALHQNARVDALEQLYNYLVSNNRYSNYLWSEEGFPDLKNEIDPLNSCIENLRNIDTRSTQWFKNNIFNDIFENIKSISSPSEKNYFEENIQNPEVIQSLIEFCENYKQDELVNYKVEIYELAERVIHDKFLNGVCQASNISEEQSTSLFELWKSVVSECYENVSRNDQHKSSDLYKGLTDIYDRISKFKKVIQDTLLDPSNSENTTLFIAVNKQMTKDLEYIIKRMPAIICARDRNGLMYPLQEKIHDFVWNRVEITGDQSGQSMMMYIYGHTGTAGVNDNRLSYISLDNLDSKRSVERITFSGIKCKNEKVFKKVAKPTSVKCTPCLFKAKRPRLEDGTKVPESKKINFGQSS
ncbi:MAG: hypothetical protein P8L77_04135 [Gammaproteobacteria bacterium]|nr:hypothetical protein [Gammaproteobacteria bacterium]